MRYVGSRETAKDILHDGFIVLFSKLETFKGDGSFEGWARRIFINTALMYMRKADVLKFSEAIESSAVVGEMIIAPRVMDKMDADKLMSLVAAMPAGFRTVFNMYVIEGYTHQEIANELNITDGGSRSQLSRARLWLQEKIKEFNLDK